MEGNNPLLDTQTAVTLLNNQKKIASWLIKGASENPYPPAIKNFLADYEGVKAVVTQLQNNLISLRNEKEELLAQINALSQRVSSLEEARVQATPAPTEPPKPAKKAEKIKPEKVEMGTVAEENSLLDLSLSEVEAGEVSPSAIDALSTQIDGLMAGLEQK